MKKLLKISDWLLLGLTGCIDVLEEIRDPLGLFEGYYKTFYGFVPIKFKKNKFQLQFWRALKTGNIEKVIENGEVKLRLTSAGIEKLKRDFPIIMLKNKKWDGKWRLVIFDIAEKVRIVRNWLRKKLKELGFGQLQKSVWLSPHDVLADFKEFIENNNLGKNVILVETKHFFVDNPKELAEKIWGLSKLNLRYSELYNELQRFKNNDEEYIKKFADRTTFRNHLKMQTLSLYLEDPFLPDQLLPDDWNGKKVINLVKELNLFISDSE